MESNIVGYFDWQGYFLCPNCTMKCSFPMSQATPVYDINIAPYSQDCAMCKEVIMKGHIDTILFDNVALANQLYPKVNGL